MMATDGSLEGIMYAISQRPNIPSVFFRDEFSGLVEMMNKKDYYAGMMETFTKLYDGRTSKRLLRRETIELVDPILVILAGGIKDRILNQLGHDFVSSGFLPRFVFTLAESDINRLRPLGPPSIKTVETRSVLVKRLREMYAFYTRKNVLMVNDVAIESDRIWDIDLDEEAWTLYGRMETKFYEMALATAQPDIVAPMYARLAMSCLKAAALLAAAEGLNDKIVVTRKHLVKAFAFGEQWRLDADNIINNIGRSSSEVMLDSILKIATQKPGVTRSEIMNRLRLNAKDVFSYLDTLEMRGLITVNRGKNKNWTIHSNLKV
jgi:predicted transcriptional regulator